MDENGLKSPPVLGGPGMKTQDESLAKQNTKASGNEQYLEVPQSRPSLDTISGLSTYSLEEFAAARPTGRSLNSDDHQRIPSRSPAPPNTIRARWSHLWQAQKGVFLMILSQFFAAAMATTARFMETANDHGEPMSTFQILFVRMSITVLSSMAYMYIAKVPDAPLGKKEIRPLLLARGFGGFFGVFGLYYSLVYLPLAEATVITFLAPMVAAWACSIFIKTPFTRTQQIAFAISLFGVVLIAQPFQFITAPEQQAETPVKNATEATSITNGTHTGDEAEVGITPAQHLFAVIVGLTGVCGAACAYTTLSWIGKRAHPLISVNYFGTWCTIVSAIALIFVPSVTFRLPSGIREWTLMAFLGISGFVMQILLTASLAHTGGGKGLNMVYTQMLFALGFDKLVWGVSPGVISIVGSSLILGSAIWVAMKKEVKKEPALAERLDEEEGLVRGMERNDGIVDSEGLHSNRSLTEQLQDMELRPMDSRG